MHGGGGRACILSFPGLAQRVPSQPVKNIVLVHGAFADGSCGLGVAFVSSATRWRCPESVALLPVTDLKLPLPFALIWRKDNASPLLAKFVADVRQLPEVEAYSKR